MSNLKQYYLHVGLVIVLCSWASTGARTQAPRAVWQHQPSGVTTSLRGLSAVSSRVVWASGADGTLLRTIDGGAHWTVLTPPARGEKLDFRDIDAVSERVAYALSIGNGATSRIYKTIDGGAHWELRLANSDPKVFFDAMVFRDADHGFVFSDSVAGRFFVITTSDGGGSWARVATSRLPPAATDEGAFAASGTNLAVSGPHVWIGTTVSRVLHSADDGRNWKVVATPMATGKATGIFSIAFRDPQHGVAVGGNYEKEPAAIDNGAVTSDGGATWSLVKGLGGFRSVVAWVPGDRRSLIAVGPAGADWSSDEGHTWTPLPIAALAGQPAGFHTFSFAPEGGVGWAAGSGGRIAKLTLR
ncbi:MAG: oxidoreductase [Vicinamibacterales bacterium]